MRQKRDFLGFVRQMCAKSFPQGTFQEITKPRKRDVYRVFGSCGGTDLNLRPSGYEMDGKDFVISTQC